MLHNMFVLAVGDHFFIISKMNKTSCFISGHFINIYIINRTLHGWRYLSLVRFAYSWEMLSALEDKICIPARPCNILYFFAFFYSKIRCLTNEFHSKFYAKNRYRMNPEAMSTISIFRVKFTLQFTSLAINFSCAAWVLKENKHTLSEQMEKEKSHFRINCQ